MSILIRPFKAININPYEYYLYKSDKGLHQLIKANDAYSSVLARIKPFLTEYCRNHVFNFVSSLGLADQVIRCQTDSICLKRKYNFKNQVYPPIPEDKSTGLIKWYNVNSYYHVCKKCNEEYKFCKSVRHVCESTIL